MAITPEQCFRELGLQHWLPKDTLPKFITGSCVGFQACHWIFIYFYINLTPKGSSARNPPFYPRNPNCSKRHDSGAAKSGLVKYCDLPRCRDFMWLYKVLRFQFTFLYFEGPGTSQSKWSRKNSSGSLIV